MRISTRKRDMPTRLRYCKLFLNNEVYDNGDLVHFALMDEFEQVKTKETLTYSKWICAMKEDLELI